jgi:ferredoxin
MSLEEKVRSRVLDLDADFVGIAPRSRFDGAPEHSDPQKVLPNFHSVIAFGIAMNRGALEAWFNKSNRRPLVLQNRLATEELDRISLHLSRWLERHGFKSVFVSQNLCFNTFRGRPDFSHKHAAMAAGLGRLGLSSNFVHTKFGAAVHLASVITEADLAPDPMIDDDHAPCHRCKICLEICPVQAISREREKSFIMEGQEYFHQWVDKLRCGWGCAGLSGHQYQIGNRAAGTWSYNNLPVPPDRREFGTKFIEADHFLRHPMELAEVLITEGTEYCGNCNKVCVGSKRDNAALLRLHVNSGIVKIPADLTLVLHLESANAKLEKYRIPAEEVAALLKS